MPELNTDAELEALLAETRTVAVLGAHPSRARPAYYVPQDLYEKGVTCLPVNPRFLGDALWGAPFVEKVSDLGVPVDIVDVFRRPEIVPEHVDEILAMNPRPRCVWLQLGIRNDAAAKRLLDAGIDVVQDKCLLVEHRRLGP